MSADEQRPHATIEARLPSHRFRCLGEASLADAGLAEHDRHASPTGPGLADQSC